MRKEKRNNPSISKLEGKRLGPDRPNVESEQLNKVRLFKAGDHYKGAGTRTGYFLLKETPKGREIIQVYGKEGVNGSFKNIVKASESSDGAFQEHGRSGSEWWASEVSLDDPIVKEILEYQKVENFEDIQEEFSFQEITDGSQGDIESIPHNEAADFIISTLLRDFDERGRVKGDQKVRVSFRVAPHEEVTISAYSKEAIEEKENRIRELVENAKGKGDITVSTSNTHIRMGKSL